MEKWKMGLWNLVCCFCCAVVFHYYGLWCNKIIGVLGHAFALYGCPGPGTTWANEVNFGMNHAPGVGSIAQPVDLQYHCATDAP